MEINESDSIELVFASGGGTKIFFGWCKNRNLQYALSKNDQKCFKSFYL